MADETSSASSAFSPLSGGYLLIVLSEPHSEQHKQVLLEHLTKGLASWDSVGTQIDIEAELRNIAAQCPNGEEVRNGEKLIQLASDSLVTEILIQPQLSTLKQCMRNLLASFTRHRHVIHAGYTLSGPGSWILQDGTYEFSDFMHIVRDAEIQRIYRAYESSITMDLHCADEGQWSADQINQDPAIKAAKISINPAGRLSSTDSQGMQDAVNSFIRYISDVLPSVTLDHLLEPSDVVGNIRFNHPTLYVFPGGQGDSALFGISGFNILVDGGFGRKPCFWDFTRHLDRLDAVVMTRMNASSLSGLTGAICRKASSPVYPQMGHIFCNLPRDSEIGLGDIEQQLYAADSSSESLNVNINDLCRAMSAGLGALQLKAQPIYRSATLEPINLYHKVGHGTLDMFIISPNANSPEVKELMRLWRSGEVATALRTVKMGGKEFSLPLLDIVSVCALLVWQPADPNEPVTRLLFPGSAPQNKILEGLEKFKQLEFLKSPVFMAKDVAPPPSAVITPSSTSSAFTKSPVKAKTSSPRHTPIEPVVAKAATVRKEASKPPAKAADHSNNTKEATPRPATKIIKADVLSSSSRTGSAELRAKKPEAKPAAAPIKSAVTAKKDGPTGLSNGETNKALAPKIKKDVANMKMVEARVHSFKSPASLKRAEENKSKKPTPDDKETKEKTAAQRSQSQSREKRSASSVRAQPADEEKPRVKLVKKIASTTSEATPASPAKPAKPIKAKAKELSTKPIEPKAPVTKDVKKDKPTTATPKTKPIAVKETSSKPAPKASAPQTSTPTPSGKAVKRPVKPAAAAAAAAAVAVGAATAVVAVAAVVSEEQAPTAEEQPAVVEENFSAVEAPEAASSPKDVEATADDQVPDEASVLDALESQIVEDAETAEDQPHQESEQESQSAYLEDEAETEEKDEEVAEESTEGEVADAEDTEVIEKDEEAEAQVEEDDEAASEETEVVDSAVAEDVAETEEANVAETEEADVAAEEAVVAETEEAEVGETGEADVAETEEVEEAEVAETEEVEEAGVAETEEVEEAEVAETVEAEVAHTVEPGVAVKDETEITEAEETDITEKEEIEVAEKEDADVVDAEHAEVAEVTETEDADVTKTDEARVTEAEDAEVAGTDEVETADEIIESHEEIAPTEVKERTDDKEKKIQDTAEIQEMPEAEHGKADKDPEEADVKETGKEVHDDVLDVKIGNEPEMEVGRSIDDEIVADVAQIDRSDDQDVNLETDECQEPVEEESQLAVSSKSVDAGRPSASPQPILSEDEMASREMQVDDVIDQIEQSQDIERAHPTSQLEGENENIKDELSELEKEQEKEISTHIHHEDVCVSSETMEEEIQQAVSSPSVETSKATACSEILDSDDRVEEVSAHEEVHTTVTAHEESSLEYEKEDKKEEFKIPEAIACQLFGNGDTIAVTLDTNEQVEVTVSGDTDDDAGHEDDHLVSHEVEKRQIHELIVESHQDDVLSSLSSASDLEPTPVLDRSGASLYDEEHQLSSMESQPESHQFTQKSAPQMVEETPKGSKQTAKVPVVDDVASGPAEEVEEEFKAEIIVRPVPVVDPSDIVVPQQPIPTPPVVKSPIKEIPSALVLDQEEDEGEEVEEEAFHKEVKIKDCAVPITPTEEDHAFGYSEPERQSEDRQLSSSMPTSSDVTGKKEESTTDGSVSLSRTKEAEADAFRATIDNQYAGFINVETSFEDADEKPKPQTPEVVEQSKKTEDKPLAEKKLPTPVDVKEDHFAAVEEKKHGHEATKSDVKPVEKAEESDEEEPVVEEVVSKALDNKSVKSEKCEEFNVKDIIKSEMKLKNESESLKDVVEDMMAEKVEIPSTDEKSVKVSAEPEGESEHLVESSKALKIESTPWTKEVESSKSHETFVVEDVKSFVKDVHALVEEIQLSKVEVKSVESEKKQVLPEEPKFEKPTANIDIAPVFKDDFATNVAAVSSDIKFDDLKESATLEKEQISQVIEEVYAVKDIKEKVKSPVEEMFEKVSAVAVSKIAEKEKCDVEGISEKVYELSKIEAKEQSIIEEIIEKASSLAGSKTSEKADLMEDIVEKPINASVDAPKIAEKNVVGDIVDKVVELPKMAESLVEDIVEKVSSVQIPKTPEKELNLLKEKASPVTATPKSSVSAGDETEVFSKVTEKLDDIVFEKCEKYGKMEKDILSTVDEPIQQATAETAIFSAEGKSQRSSTSEAIPLELEFEISERKLSDICASAISQLEKDEPVDVTLLKTEVTLTGKSTKEEVIVDPTFVAPLTASSPIDGPELLKELTFPLGLPAKADEVLPKDKLEQVGAFIQEVKDTPVEYETDYSKESKATEVEEIIQDAKNVSVEQTSKCETAFTHDIKTEVKDIIQDVKATLVESKSEVESSREIKTDEVKEIIQNAKDVSIELASKSTVESSYKIKTEEVKDTIQMTKDVSVEMASKSDIDFSHPTKVEEVTEIVQEIESVTLQLTAKSETDCSFTSKVVEVKEEIHEIKKTSIELAPESKMDILHHVQEEVKETIQDVKKATVELSSKSEVDHMSKSKVEEVCETIQEVKELQSTISTMSDKLEAKPETHMEVKTVHSEPEVIPQATFQLKCDPLANLPVADLVEPSKTVIGELENPKNADLAKLEIVEKTEQLKPDAMDYATVSGSSSTSVTPKTPLSPNLAHREVVDSKVSPGVQMAATLESFAAPPARFEDEISQPSSLDSVEVHSTSSATWAATETHQEEDENVGSVSLTPTINYLAAGYEGVNISTSSKLSTIASSDGEAEAAQPLSLDSNWSSKTFDKLTADSSARHRPEESAFSSGPSSWDEREPNTRPYYVVSESISDRSATSSIISHAADEDYPTEKQDRPSLDSHLEPLTSSELSNKKELGVLPVSPVPSSPFSTDRCSSHGDFEANKDSLSSIQTSESSDYHLETKVDDSHSAISSTRSDYSDDRSGSSIDPSLLQQQRLEQRSLTPRSDISCSSDATDPITTANTITSELIQPGQQPTSVEMKASSKAELADPKLAPHNIWLKEKDTASSPNPFTDQYVDDDTDHPVPVEHASSALYYPQQKEQPQHLSDFESDRHSDSQSSSVPVAEYTDEYYAQHLEFVEASHKSSQPHTDEVSDQEAYLYESEHDDHDQHYHPYATKYSDSYDEADLYPTEEAINDDYRHMGDHQNGNAYHYYEGSEQDSMEANVVGHPPHQYEDQNRNDRTPTRDVQHSYVAADVYDTEPAVYSPTSRQLDVAEALAAPASRDDRVVPQASSLPSPPPQQSAQSTQQQHEDILASWGKPLGLPAPVAPGVVFSSNGTNGSPLKRPTTASNNANKSAEKATNGTNAMIGATPFYVDLAYIPHHSDPQYSDVEFFKRVRARHYVLSTLEPSAQVLDALLEGKQSWTGDDKDLDVTIIPTYDSDALAVWVSANEDVLARNRIDLAPSASRCTINLQDHETSCSAYRLEF